MHGMSKFAVYLRELRETGFKNTQLSLLCVNWGIQAEGGLAL